MFKVMVLLAKRADLTRDQFIAYYEANHVALVRSKFPWIVKYHRNYVDLTGAIIMPTVAAPDFDVITEIWFKDRAGYEKMLSDHGKPEVAKAIADDEAHFLDRTKTRFFIVDEHASALG